MKWIIFAWLLCASPSAFAECRALDFVARDFVRLRAPMGECVRDLYHANGRKAFNAATGDWYHNNGVYAYWSERGNWYYGNRNVAFWAENGNWYHLNGAIAYWSQNGNWYYPNRNTAYVGTSGNWYHINGQIAYWSEQGRWYYANGTFAGQSDKAVPTEAVEFILNDSCATSASIFCVVGQMVPTHTPQPAPRP